MSASGQKQPVDVSKKTQGNSPAESSAYQLWVKPNVFKIIAVDVKTIARRQIEISDNFW